MEGENLRVSGPSFWPRGGSPILHQTFEASHCLSQKDWCKNHHLLGRHDFAKSKQSVIIAGLDLAEVASRKPWVSHQLEKVGMGSHTGDYLPGFPDRLRKNDHSSSHREDQENHSKMPTSCVQEGDKSSQDIGNIGPDDVITTGYSPSPTSLSTFANDSNSGTFDQQVIPSQAVTNPGVFTGTEMVDFPDAELEWQVHHFGRARSDFDKRCLQEGLGRDLGFEAGSGTMNTIRNGSAYQCPVIESGLVRPEILRPASSKSACSHENGQPNSCCIHPEDGWHSLGTHATYNSGNLEICSGQGNSPVSRIFTRVPEHGRGLGIEKLPGRQRLAVEGMRVSSAEQSVGTVQTGHVCKSPHYTARALCQLVPRPIRTGSGCLPTTLERGGTISVLTICHDPKVLNESSPGKGISCSDSTPLADSAMVSKPSLSVVGQPDSTPTVQGSFVVPISENTPTSTPESVSSGGLESLRRRDLDQGISEHAAKLLVEHSWRKGTATAYNSSWRQWCSWCNGKQVDPFRAPVVDIVNYLSERFDKGDSYRTLNSRRSAISAFHVLEDGLKTGQHPLVKRFLTATFNARPPQPRYTVQWDVNLLLAYIKSMGPNVTLTDMLLTLKLAMLLALVSAGRTSELSAFDIRFLADFGDTISFQLAKLTKSRRTGQPPLS